MSNPAVLVDTNVWLNYEIQADSDLDSPEFVSWAFRNGVRVGIAAHSLKDLFALMTRDLKRMSSQRLGADAARASRAARAAAWAAVEQLLERAEVVGSDYMDAYLATKYRALHDFYEDDLVIAAAERMGADAIVTNDVKLAKRSPVKAMTPGEALAWLQVRAALG